MSLTLLNLCGEIAVLHLVTRSTFFVKLLLLVARASVEPAQSSNRICALALYTVQVSSLSLLLRRCCAL